MKRRGFIAALGTVMNGTLLRWSERDNRHTAHPRTWLLGERTHIEHAGWSVCVLKGTDETARWQKCEAPNGIYNLREG